MFTEDDVRQMNARGLTLAGVKEQLRRFREGFPPLAVVEAASIGNGIIRTTEESRARYAELYEKYRQTHAVVKFVPASGAATRMFKDLFDFILTGNSNKVTNEVLARTDMFAFWDELNEYLPENPSAEEIVAAIISGKGLNYGYQPKALILFHKYADGARAALEEHLVEGAEYAACNGGVSIHFTVSPEHREGFDELLGRAVALYGSRFGVDYGVTMSEQKSSTDTIAVNPDNTPFRNPDGSLLFRPAGHGALLENLNDIEADIVFIKNIDNVTTDSRREETVIYKKVLAGILVDLQERSFGYLRELEKQAAPNNELLNEVAGFIGDELRVRFALDRFEALSAEGKKAFLTSILDRPIRVCGMVENEGEPGGGPFWARNADGTVSLHIVESSQIAPEQQNMITEGTHFNPVDLACGLRRYNGEKFDLARYTDPTTGFISEKSKDGKPLRAQELPGLWNGSMSRWNTVFAEVPVSTFTPVKVVTDLLRPEHQE